MTLALADPSTTTSTVSGFGSGDVVDLQKLIATTLTYGGGTLTLLDNQTMVDTLTFIGSYPAASITLRSDNKAGTAVLYTTPEQLAHDFGMATVAQHHPGIRGPCRLRSPAALGTSPKPARCRGLMRRCRHTAPAEACWFRQGMESRKLGGTSRPLDPPSLPEL